MSATMGATGGNRVDITVKVNLHNMADIAKIGKKVNTQVQEMQNQFKKMGKQVGNVNVQVKSMDKSVNSLGNQMGFVAFQWMFISGIAARTLMQIRQLGTEIIQTGAKGAEQLIRAIVTTRKLGESQEQAALRTKASFNFIMTMARTTGKETVEVAEAFKEVGKALKDVNGTIPITAEVMKLAVIEEVNIAEAAKGFIGVMNNYDKSIGSAAEVTKTLLGVNLQSRVSLGELIHAFEFSAATASDFGMTIQETGTLLGVMGDQLTPGRIGRQFATMLEELRAASLKMAPQMEAMGVSVYNAEGNMRSLPDVLKDIAKGAKEAGVQGDRFRDQFIDMMKLDKVSKRALLGLIDDMDKYDSALQELTSDDMTKALARQWEELTNTPEANLNKLKVVTEQLKMELVGGLAPGLAAVTQEVLALTQMAEINKLFFDLGKEIGDLLIPVVRTVARMVKTFRKEITALTKQIKFIVPIAMLFTASLVSMFVVATLITMFATFGAVMSKWSITMAIATRMNMALFSIMGYVAIAAILAVVAIFAVHQMINELKKDVEDINPVIVGFTAAIAGAAIGLAFIINPLLGIAVAVAVAIPLIALAIEAFNDMANAQNAMLGIHPGDDFAMSFLIVFNHILKGIKEWGRDVRDAIAVSIDEWLAEMKAKFDADLEASFERFTKIWEFLSPALGIFHIFGVAAINHVWAGLKEAFPILQDFEDWLNKMGTDLEKWATEAGHDMGTALANAFVDAILAVLGPVGIIIRMISGIDIDKMIADRRKVSQDQDFLPPKDDTRKEGGAMSEAYQQHLYEQNKRLYEVGKAPGQLNPVTGKKFTDEQMDAMEQQRKIDRMGTPHYTKDLSEFIGGTVGTEAEFKERDKLKAQLDDPNAKPLTKEEMSRLKTLMTRTTEKETPVDEDLQRVFKELEKSGALEGWKVQDLLELKSIYDKPQAGLTPTDAGFTPKHVPGEEAPKGPPPEPPVGETEAERIAREAAEEGYSTGEPTPEVTVPELTAAQQSKLDISELAGRDTWMEYLADQFIKRDGLIGNYVVGHAQLGKDHISGFMKTQSKDVRNSILLSMNARKAAMSEEEHAAAEALEQAKGQAAIQERIDQAKQQQEMFDPGGDPRWSQDADGNWKKSEGYDMSQKGAEGSIGIVDAEGNTFDSLEEYQASLSILAEGLNEHSLANQEATAGLTSYNEAVIPVGAAYLKNLGMVMKNSLATSGLSELQKLLGLATGKQTETGNLNTLSLLQLIQAFKGNILATGNLTSAEKLDNFWILKHIAAIMQNIGGVDSLSDIQDKLKALILGGEIPGISQLIGKNISVGDAIDHATGGWDKLDAALQETVRRLSAMYLTVSLRVNKDGDVIGASAQVHMPGYSGPQPSLTGGTPILQGKSLEELLADAQAANKPIRDNVFGTGQNPWIPAVIEGAQNLQNKIGDAWVNTVTMFGTGAGWFGEATPGFELSNKRGTNVFNDQGQPSFNPIQALANVGEFFKDPVASIEKSLAPLKPTPSDELLQVLENIANASIETLNVNMNIENLDPTTDIEAVADEVVERITDDIKANRRF